jgi:hypothetical protein
MKKSILKPVYFVSLVILFFLLPINWLSSEEKATGQIPSGEQLINGFFDNLYVKTDEKSVISLRLVNKQGMERNRKIIMYSKRSPDGTMSVLIKFIAPQEMADTALLSIENKNRESDQWLYLPAFKKTKRIAGADKQDSFMGTDFTFEDIQVENPKNYTYKTLRSEKLDGKDCWVVEASPRPEYKDSGYTKRVLWLDKATNFAAKIDYYDKKGKLQKTQIPSEMVNENGRWIANQAKIVDLIKEHKTFLVVEKRLTNTGIPNDIFTIRSLEKPSR